MRTLKDLLNEPIHVARVAHGVNVDGLMHRVELVGPASVAYARCRCGRHVPADMMLDLDPDGTGGVSAELRGNDRYRCDACWRRWILERRIESDELRRLTGQAPRSNPRKGW